MFFKSAKTRICSNFIEDLYFLVRVHCVKKSAHFLTLKVKEGGGGSNFPFWLQNARKKHFCIFFLYWQNPLKNKIWLPSWRLLALRRSLCNQIQLKQTRFYKPYRCVQGWRISIAKLSSKDKFYYKLLGGMSIQFWGSSGDLRYYLLSETHLIICPLTKMSKASQI